MADGRLNIVLRVTNEGKVKKALQGVTKEATKAEKQIRKEMQKTATQKQRDFRTQEMGLRSAAKRATQINRRAQKEQRKDNERTARELQRNQIKAAKEIARQRRAILKGTIAGVAAGGAFVARRAQQLGGIPGTQERLGFAMEFGQSLIRLQGQTKMTDDELASLRESIVNVSNATNISADQLLAGVDKAQEKFSDVTIVTDNMLDLAKMAKALNADFADVVNALGQFGQNLGVTADQVPELMGAFEQAQEQGAITVADAARTMSQSIGFFSQATGQTGIGGARQFLATTQVLAKGGANPEQIRTQLEGLLRVFIDKDRRKRIGGILGGGAGKDVAAGRLDMNAFAGALAKLNQKQFEEVLKQLGESEAKKAAITLRGQEKISAGIVGTIAGADAAAGLEVIRGTAGKLTGSKSGELENIRIRSLNTAITNTDKLAAAVIGVAGPLADLQSEFPLLTEAVGAATIALGVFAVTAGLGGAGGKGGAILKGGGKVLGKVGGGAAAAASSAAGTAAIGLLAAGGIGAAVGHSANKIVEGVTGKSISDRIVDPGALDFATTTKRGLEQAGKDQKKAAETFSRSVYRLESILASPLNNGQTEGN